LLDLKELKGQGFLDTKRLISTGQLNRDALNNAKVYVVEGVRATDWESDTSKHANKRYVTLSHCWGNSVPITLTPDNIEQFMNGGITLDSLPKTFRDAIVFAARLDGVGYMWIDSLCIKQGPSQASRDDWLMESAVMGRVYRESYLNISATAAQNSDQGLFFARQAQLLLENEVSLNIEGIPGVRHTPGGLPSPDERSLHILDREDTAFSQSITASTVIQYIRSYVVIQAILRWIVLAKKIACYYAQGNPRKGKPLQDSHVHASPTDTETHVSSLSRSFTQEIDPINTNLRRCTILDVSMWKDIVDEAPVNKRGWVLQERLMAPRVLHFCHNQVAWECLEFDAAEGHPHGIPNFQLTSDGIFESRTLKGLDSARDGRRLREMRLKGSPDPVSPHLRPQIFAFELWRRIVEVYSRTAISHWEDKLVALSGIAGSMADIIGLGQGPAEYCAGLWRPCLESQLLWKVEPLFREASNVDHPGHFVHVTGSPSPSKYRAPSFSWASIDADQGNGIVYAEVTDQDILIRVEDVYIARKSDNQYGLVSDGKLVLRGYLRRIQIKQKERGRFGWYTLERGLDLDAEEHTNVYLDCASRDIPDILGHDAGVYVLPVAITECTPMNKDSGYMTCLLLQQIESDDQPGVYRRIGLTKLSPWADKLARRRILDRQESDVDISHQEYDEISGRHQIVII
jgi:hypothetical protein